DEVDAGDRVVHGEHQYRAHRDEKQTESKCWHQASPSIYSSQISRMMMMIRASTPPPMYILPPFVAVRDGDYEQLRDEKAISSSAPSDTQQQVGARTAALRAARHRE